MFYFSDFSIFLKDINYWFLIFLQEKLKQPKPEREPDIKTLPPIVFKEHIRYSDDFFDCAQICDDLMWV